MTEKCSVCGSTDTVRHNATATLKPNWLHCRGCGRCAATEDMPAPAEEPEAEPAAVEEPQPEDDEPTEDGDAGRITARRRR
jgi:MinD superfamily P-loop ATPase